MICRGRRGFILFGIAFSLGGQTAQAGERHRLSIPAQPMTTAVLQLGVQARVSINAGAAAACGRSRAVRGSHDVQSALRLMTEGSACAFRRIDDRTYIITPRPQPRPAPSPRTAPEAPPAEHVPFAVDDVIVTATKRDLALANAPYALSALDGDAFDASARQDTAALATRLAGLTVTNLGSGRNKLFVRGLADSPLTGQTQAMVGLYLDETRLTYDAPDPDLRLVDLERVELLRGPQASLYGAGAMGGVLKLVSRAPELDAYSGKVSAGVSFAKNSISGNSTDIIFNAPLIRDRLAMRTVLYQERFGGVVDDTNLGLIDTGRTVRSGTRMTLLWRIDPQWQARLGWVRQDIRINDSQYAFESHGPYERALSKCEPSNNNFSGIALAVTGDLSWGRVKITNAFQAHELGRRYDATRAAGSLGASGGPLIYDEADSIEAVALEMSVATHPGGPFEGIAGVYASQYEHDRAGELRDLEPDQQLFRAIKQDKTWEAALFGEAAWNPLDRVKLTVGGRYFVVAILSHTYQQSRVSEDKFEGQHEDADFALKSVLEYDVSDSLLAYVQQSQGYRVGGFNGGALIDKPYGRPGSGAPPFREFAPDRLYSLEAGVRWRGFDNRLMLRAAAFRTRWEDIQSDRVSPDGLPFTANIGSGGSTGIEVEGVWRDGPWRLDFNFMANDARLETADENYPLEEGGHLPGVPRVLSAASARREVSLGGLPGWISGSVGYVGPSSQQLSPVATTQMGDYVTSEVAASVAMGAWDATLRIDNLFNGSGDTFGYGNPFLVGREAVATPQRPRSFALSLTRSF